MARGISHAPRNHVTRRCGNQTSASQGTATTNSSSERTRPAAPPQVEPPKKRGRKPGSRNKLKPLAQAGRVALRPNGDMQFRYVNYESPPPYKYTTQLGVILKREYPGVLQDRDEDGVLISERAATEWADYFHGSQQGVTSGDRVLSEFWRLFKVEEEDQEEADRVLENYLKKKVRDMIYQARVDCVKVYYTKKYGSCNDTQARPIELGYEEYKEGRLTCVARAL